MEAVCSSETCGNYPLGYTMS